MSEHLNGDINDEETVDEQIERREVRLGLDEGARTIRYFHHPTFEEPDADVCYKQEFPEELGAWMTSSFMPHDSTIKFCKQMHYAAYEVERAKGIGEKRRSVSRYFEIRDAIILGNRKLVFRPVQKEAKDPDAVEELVCSMQPILIRAIESFNPWLGVQFSTYVVTCLRRELAYIQRRNAHITAKTIHLEDWDISPEAFAESEREEKGRESIHSMLHVLRGFVGPDSQLLNDREKKILVLRFLGDESISLDKVGKLIGISKERVRQIQARALQKVREALTNKSAA